MWWLRLALVALLAPFGLFPTGAARAQRSAVDPASVRDPRVAFRAGQEAASGERWAESERWFARAYALSEAPSALFNQAVALRALGRDVEARGAFRVVLGAEVGEAIRQRARAFLEELESRVATLRIEGLAPAIPHELQLDGATREDDLRRPLTLPIDAGTHALRLEREGYAPFTWRGEIGPGVTRTLTVELDPLPPPATASSASGGSVLEEPWLWILVGGVALAGVAVGIGIGVAEAQLSPASEVVFEL